MRPFGGIQVSADYWNYRYKDLIGSALDPQAILDNDCRLDGIPNDPRVIRDGNAGISEILTSFVNVGTCRD